MSSGLEVKASDPECGQELRFRWVWDVDAMTVSIEFSCPVGKEKPGQLARNPRKNIGSKVSANRTRGAELFLYSDSHRGVAQKRKWLASLAIQVNTKRRCRAHIGEPFGSRSNASAFSTGHLE
jgi:hypothetical protein